VFFSLRVATDDKGVRMTSRSGESRDHSVAAGYAVAVIACVTAGAAVYFFRPLFEERFSLTALPAAVVVAAWWGGLGPGLLATLGGTLAGAYLLSRPVQVLQMGAWSNAASLLLFTLVGVLTSVAVRQLRRQALTERDARVETGRQLRQTTHLQQLTATLLRARAPADVTGMCLPELLHAVDATAGAVFLISDDGSEYELADAVGYDNRRAASAGRFPVALDSPLAEAIRRRELVVVESSPMSAVEGDEASLDRFPKFCEGDVVVPLIAAGRASGAVVLSIENARTIDGDEREFLLAAGRHTAQALDRARLYETAERARADAEALRLRANSELRERQKAEEALRLSEARYRALAARTSRLYALSAGLSEAVSLDAVARVIVRLGKVVVGASAGSVAMLVDGGSHFETLYGEEHGSKAVESPRLLPSGTGLCSTAAVETRRPVFVGSFSEWQEKYPRSASIAADGGYASAATLPLLADGAVFGVLSCQFAVPVNFDDEYSALLTSVAQHCAQALDRARLYETADRARADAEAANRSKDDFLSTISHELRTPLNAMLGWAAMLRNGSVEASRTQRAIEAIFNNATRQSRLIEELLDVSKIVAGRASFDLQTVNLGENIGGAVEAMMPLAAAKGVELRFEATPDLYVVADPRRLEQVFLNLLSNAVKFTPRDGLITVHAAASGESAHVRVVDTGAGMEPAFLPHAFERFRQADSGPSRSVGGLGLGLFIAHQLVEGQGGVIRVDSEGVGRGATFTVTMPACEGVGALRHTAATASAASPPEPTAPMPVLDGIRVLLVDDEPDAREVMASALETCGATVFSAASTPEALETLARSDVHLLLADIAMPGQDGYQLIRAIRAMPSPHLAAIPAAAVTAHARNDERERALAAGFQMHLTKPIEPAALARAVAVLAANARSSP
jgi:signal transduction histidine kinase/ActR/RegA family two-component response regulator/PAS domain-containing protein